MKEGIPRREFLRILGLGALAAATPACDSDVLGAGSCETPEKTSESLDFELEFEQTDLSERQRSYIRAAIEQEMSKIEPRFRQGISTIIIMNPEYEEECGCAGSYNDFGNTIRFPGPKAGDPELHESERSIDIDEFHAGVARNLVHEVGHHVDMSLGGQADLYTSAAPHIYQLYGRGDNPNYADGMTPAREDFAEGFRLFQRNKYVFPIFFYGLDPKYKDKYEVMKREIFCGTEYPIADIVETTGEVGRLVGRKFGAIPDEKDLHDKLKLTANYEKLKKDSPQLFVDKQFEGFYRYFVFAYSMFSPNSLEDERENGYASLNKLYQETKQFAQEIGWAELERAVDSKQVEHLSLFRINVKLPNGGNDLIRPDGALEQAIEIAERLLKDDKLVNFKKTSLKFKLASILVEVGKKEEAVAVLQGMVNDFPETTSADQAVNAIKEIQKT